MGNFSRNTFHPEKNYVGVRLQQGVPLVDADWNELNDVGRHELYNAMSVGFANGVGRIRDLNFGSDVFAYWILPLGLTNDFYFLQDSAIVEGRPLRLPTLWLRYNEQPWIDPARAAHDGVAVLAPLTTPGAARSDMVYLDVWEREVGQAEDTEIVNPVIGVETAVRLKREACVRVAEGATELPAPPAGHRFMLLAVLNRPAAGAIIQIGEMVDHRSRLDSTPAQRVLSLVPSFQPITLGGWPEWQLILDGETSVHALKPAGTNALGVIPVNLPHGAKLTSLQIRGVTSGTAQNFFYSLVRSEGYSTSGGGASLGSENLTTIGTFTRTLSILPQAQNLHIVDNNSYHYYFYVWASGASLTVEIHGLSVRYEF
jgi:hypothetical protein